MEPLSRDGIDLVRFRRDSASDLILEFTSADLPAFDVTEEAEPLLDQQVVMNVEIVSVAFAEGNKWRLSDGAATFWARIADIDFLSRVDRREEVFAKGDILRCEMRVEQSRTEAGLVTDRTVVHVQAHTPASKPLTLSLDDEDHAE